MKAPSASLPCMADSGACPRPMARPREKLRDCAEPQVSTRSPSPDRPINVSGCAPQARPKRLSSAKPRATSAAPALAPRPRPAAMPQAMARTFLAAPPISTPVTSQE